MNKKIYGVLIAVMMLLLAGCAKKPTPEELIDGIQEIDLSGHYYSGLDMSFQIKTDEGERSLNMAFNAECSPNVFHLENYDINLAADGESSQFNIEAWKSEDETYISATVKAGGVGFETGWVENGNGVNIGELEVKNNYGDFRAKYFDDLELEEKKDAYVVTGTIAGNNMMKMMTLNLSGILEGMNDITDYFEDAVFDVTMEFDKETCLLRHASFALNEEESDFGKDVKSIEMKIELVLSDVDPEDTDDLKIPSSVIREAEENAENPVAGTDVGANTDADISGSNMTTDTDTPDTTQNTTDQANSTGIEYTGTYAEGMQKVYNNIIAAYPGDADNIYYYDWVSSCELEWDHFEAGQYSSYFYLTMYENEEYAKDAMTSDYDYYASTMVPVEGIEQRRGYMFYSEEADKVVIAVLDKGAYYVIKYYDYAGNDFETQLNNITVINNAIGLFPAD